MRLDFDIAHNAPSIFHTIPYNELFQLVLTKIFLVSTHLFEESNLCQQGRGRAKNWNALGLKF